MWEGCAAGMAASLRPGFLGGFGGCGSGRRAGAARRLRVLGLWLLADVGIRQVKLSKQAVSFFLVVASAFPGWQGRLCWWRAGLIL